MSMECYFFKFQFATFIYSRSAISEFMDRMWYLFLLKKLLKFSDGDALRVGAKVVKNIAEKLTRKVQFLQDATEVVEADVTRVADVVLGELFFEEVCGNFEVNSCHKLLQFLKSNDTFFSGCFHFVETLSKPSLLV